MAYTNGNGNGMTSPVGTISRRITGKNANRYSVSAMYSMAAEQDTELEDDLARGTSL